MHAAAPSAAAWQWRLTGSQGRASPRDAVPTAAAAVAKQRLLLLLLLFLLLDGLRHLAGGVCVPSSECRTDAC